MTSALVDEFAMTLREGERPRVTGWQRPPLAPASVARTVVAVRSLHRFAVEEGVTASRPGPRGDPAPAAASAAEGAQPGPGPGACWTPRPTDTALGLRDAALLELLYGTGARISEAVGLDVDDVARAVAAPAEVTPGLRLFGKGGKERVVPLGSYARRALDALPGPRPGPTSPRAVAAHPRCSSTRAAAGSPGRAPGRCCGPRPSGPDSRVDVSPHTLRHSYATHLLDGGADVRVVQELLGHASVTTTQIYTLVTVDHLREVYLTAHPARSVTCSPQGPEVASLRRRLGFAQGRSTGPRVDCGENEVVGWWSERNPWWSILTTAKRQP